MLVSVTLKQYRKVHSTGQRDVFHRLVTVNDVIGSRHKYIILSRAAKVDQLAHEVENNKKKQSRLFSNTIKKNR